MTSPQLAFMLALLLAAGCTHEDRVLEATSVADQGVMVPPVETYLTCSDEQLVCGASCVDVYSDWRNCGACGNVCASGLCYSGICGDDRAGHGFVIGHSYTPSSSTKALDRVLGNALATTHDAVVDVLIYRGTNTQELAWGTHDAIVRGGNQMNRPTRRWFTPSTSGVLQRLPAVDVLVIAAQPQMSDAQLEMVRADLALAIDDFLRRGGVVIALDAPSVNNSGTARILGSALPVTRATTAPGATGSIAKPGSTPVTSVPLTFAIPNSVGYEPTGYEDVVVTESGHVLVAHRAFY